MAVEIEAKMRADEPEQLRRRLRATGAVDSGDLLEINRFFDTPQRALLAQDSGLRIRTTLSMWQKNPRHVITFKGPRLSGELKRRDEIEFEVSDADHAAALLARLGYEPGLAFEKRRQVWTLEDCEVVIVEIEGPSDHAVQRVRRRLGLEESPLVSDSYVALLAAERQRRGLDDTFIRFPDSPRSSPY
jgi:adenylate cyclase class 2